MRRDSLRQVKVTYAKNPTPEGCCCVCSKQFGRLIGLSSDCGHSEELRAEYKKRESGNHE